MDRWITFGRDDILQRESTIAALKYDEDAEKLFVECVEGVDDYNMTTKKAEWEIAKRELLGQLVAIPKHTACDTSVSVPSVISFAPGGPLKMPE